MNHAFKLEATLYTLHSLRCHACNYLLQEVVEETAATFGITMKGNNPMNERRIQINTDGIPMAHPLLKVGPDPMADFKDISGERYRSYHFPGDQVVSVNMPRLLRVSKSGHHYIVDAQERSHIVPPGWIHIQFEVKPGQPAFAF
jgi:hypothetical protein